MSEQEPSSIGRSLESFQEQERLRIAMTATINQGNNADDSSFVRPATQNVQAALEQFHSLSLEEEEDVSSEEEILEEEEVVDNFSEQNYTGLHAIPFETFETILLYVGEDDFLQCQLVCKSFGLVVTDNLWKKICLASFRMPVYMPVRVSKLGRPRRFKTWKHLVYGRKRVRLDGVYVSKKVYIRDPGPRTMWSPESYERYLEVKHFRYIVFFSDGSLLYASTPQDTRVMIPRIRNYVLSSYRRQRSEWEARAQERIAQGLEPEEFALASEHESGAKELDDRLYWGKYNVRGGSAHVTVELKKYSVKFQLEIASRQGLFFDWKLNNTLITRSHQSLYHADNESVINYPLEQYECDREWRFLELYTSS